MKSSSTNIAMTAVIASTYSVLTVILADFSYSWLQVRLSEALTPLPFLLGIPSIAGLFIGVVIANLFSPIGLPDMIFGPLLTLVAAFLSWKISFGKRIIACIYPVVINSVGVSAYISSFYGVPYIMSVGTIAVGEIISAVLVGYPLLIIVEKTVPRFLHGSHASPLS